MLTLFPEMEKIERSRAGGGEDETSFYFLNIYFLKVYLAMLGLSCGTQDL